MKLTLSNIVKHNKKYIDYNKDGRSIAETITHYVNHYSEFWTRSSNIVIDVTRNELAELLIP